MRKSHLPQYHLKLIVAATILVLFPHLGVCQSYLPNGVPRPSPRSLRPGKKDTIEIGLA